MQQLPTRACFTPGCSCKSYVPSRDSPKCVGCTHIHQPPTGGISHAVSQQAVRRYSQTPQTRLSSTHQSSNPQIARPRLPTLSSEVSRPVIEPPSPVSVPNRFAIPDIPPPRPSVPPPSSTPDIPTRPEPKELDQRVKQILISLDQALKNAGKRGLTKRDANRIIESGEIEKYLKQKDFGIQNPSNRQLNRYSSSTTQHSDLQNRFPQGPEKTSSYASNGGSESTTQPRSSGDYQSRFPQGPEKSPSTPPMNQQIGSSIQSRVQEFQNKSETTPTRPADFPNNRYSADRPALQREDPDASALKKRALPATPPTAPRPAPGTIQRLQEEIRQLKKALENETAARKAAEYRNGSQTQLFNSDKRNQALEQRVKELEMRINEREEHIKKLEGQSRTQISKIQDLTAREIQINKFVSDSQEFKAKSEEQMQRKDVEMKKLREEFQKERSSNLQMQQNQSKLLDKIKELQEDLKKKEIEKKKAGEELLVSKEKFEKANAYNQSQLLALKDRYQQEEINRVSAQQKLVFYFLDLFFSLFSLPQSREFSIF